MNETTTGQAVSAYRVSLRDHLFAVLTANVAMAFALAGWYEAEKQVLPINSARLLEIHMLQTEMRIKANQRASTRAHSSRPESDSEEAPKNPAEEVKDIEHQMMVLTEQIGDTAIIAYVWKYMMYVTAVILEAAALLSIITHQGRRAHLVAGWAVLISTVCTLVAMVLLVSPSYGGMAALPVRSYLYIALIQGGYGAILLAVFWPRKSKPEEGHSPTSRNDSAAASLGEKSGNGAT